LKSEAASLPDNPQVPGLLPALPRLQQSGCAAKRRKGCGGGRSRDGTGWPGSSTKRGLHQLPTAISCPTCRCRVPAPRTLPGQPWPFCPVPPKPLSPAAPSAGLRQGGQPWHPPSHLPLLLAPRVPQTPPACLQAVAPRGGGFCQACPPKCWALCCTWHC